MKHEVGVVSSAGEEAEMVREGQGLAATRDSSEVSGRFLVNSIQDEVLLLNQVTTTLNYTSHPVPISLRRRCSSPSMCPTS